MQKEKDVATRTIYLINPTLTIATLEETSRDPLVAANRKQEPYKLVNQVLQANQTSESLVGLCQLAKQDQKGWKL